jgi:iron(III) transport system substrate-binding protein
MQAIAAAMEKESGAKITINFTPGPSMPSVGQQIATEFQAKQKSVTDVWHTSGSYIVPLLARDMFLSADWKALLPGRITDQVIEAEGRLVRVITGLTGATYNSRLAPFKPKTTADFLKPEWKGKFASTPYAAGFDTLSATDVWGPQKTLDYARQISKQISGLIRCSEMERIASGEFLALVFDCSGQGAMVWKNRGAPLDQVVLLDAAQLRYYYMLVPKNAAHPNAATLFTAFMQTPTGQSILWNSWHSDLHLYPESNIKKQADAIIAQGGKFAEASAEWAAKHPEVEATTNEAIKILSAK